MSFILDALKKSESERQRQAGPALFEVKVAPPRHRIAPWVLALGTVLAVNLAIAAWMLMRHPSVPDREASRALPPAAAGASRAAPAAAPPVQPAPSVATPPPASSGTLATAASAPGPAAAPAGPASGAAPSSLGTANPRSDRLDSNPADYVPAAVAPGGPADAPDTAAPARDSVLPSYQQAAAAPGADLPPLRLDLHIYAAAPGRRFVFLNMVKLHQGQSLPNGVRVVRITPDGVILSYQGEKFVLHRR